MQTVSTQTRDHQRMLAVARGDLDCMSEIYQSRHRSLFRFFFRLSGRQSTAEDLVHEVFLRMLRFRHTYHQSEFETCEAGFEAWMYRIARNAFHDHTRKYRREVSPADGQLEALDNGRPTPLESASLRQDIALLNRALRELPEDKRELLVLTRYEGLSHEQIGRILGCEAGTVKGRVFRAMKELSGIYSDLLREKAS